MSRLEKPNAFSLKNYRPETGRPRAPAASPPLWVWPVVLAVLLGLYLASLPAFHAYQNRPQEEFIRINRERIRQFSTTSAPGVGPSLRVIALGNSLLYRATFLDNRMERLAEERGLRGLQFLRLTRAGGRLSHFEQLRAEIMDARTDLLLIQTGLLLSDPPLSKVYPHFLRFSIGRQMDAVKGRHRPYPNANLQQDEETPRQWRQDRAAFGQFVRSFKGQYKKGWSDPIRLAYWLDDARRRGVSLVLLELPRSIPVQALTEQGSFKTFHEALPRQWHGHILAYPEALAITHFTDFTHLNARGRTLYSHWLLEALKTFHQDAGTP